MTITKERLLKIQHWRETYGADSNVMLPAEEAAELARIALASLEAEPVAYMSRQNAKLREKFGTCDEWDVHHQSVGGGFPPIEIPESDDYEFMPLYAAPQPLTNAERAELQERRKAAMDSEPVGWTDEQELRSVEKDGCGYLFKANPISPNADPRRVIKLYRHAPPAPVVPDEMTRVPDVDVFDPGFMAGWNACRSAMLNGGKS